MMPPFIRLPFCTWMKSFLSVLCKRYIILRLLTVFSRATSNSSQLQVFTCCFLKTVFQTNAHAPLFSRLHIVLCKNAKISALFRERSRSFQHANPDLWGAIAREDDRQDENWIKLPYCCLCLRKNNNKKISMVLKRRRNQQYGKMAEPHGFHFLVLFTLRLSLLVSSTYVLQRQMKGREGERDRETSVGSYCV